MAGLGDHCMGQRFFTWNYGIVNHQVPEGLLQNGKESFLGKYIMEDLFIKHSGGLKYVFSFLRQWSRVGRAVHKRLSSISSSDNGIKYMSGAIHFTSC